MLPAVSAPKKKCPTCEELPVSMIDINQGVADDYSSDVYLNDSYYTLHGVSVAQLNSMSLAKSARDALYVTNKAHSIHATNLSRAVQIESDLRTKKAQAKSVRNEFKSRMTVFRTST